MKTISKLFFLYSFFFYINTNAQAPEKMSYQAVIRDASNNLVSNHAVGMKISLLEGSAVGPTEYVEIQTPTSNANGLVSITIGNGTVIYGTIATALWDQAAYFLKTEIDPTGGTNYTITSTSQLLSVPYALYAKKAEKTNAVDGDANYIPVFDASGQRLVSSNIYQSNTGNIGINNPVPGYPLDVIANGGVNFSSTLNDQFVQIDSNVRNFLSFSTGGLRNWAIFNNFSGHGPFVGQGEFSIYNDFTSTQSLKINRGDNLVTVQKLRIGNSTLMSSHYTGYTFVGNSATQSKIINIALPTMPDTNYRVVLTPINEGTFQDVFALSVTNKTVNGFDVVIYRIDGTSWGQNLTLDYTITSEN